MNVIVGVLVGLALYVGATVGIAYAAPWDDLHYSIVIALAMSFVVVVTAIFSVGMDWLEERDRRASCGL